MDPNRQKVQFAFFVTPHGFGHAARTAAVIEALHARLPLAEFALFTTIPQWFFDNSLTAPFVYYNVRVDIGLVQKTPLIADHARTLDELERFLPFDPALIDRLADQLAGMSCAMVVCDIAPLGIVAAMQAGIPSVLVENFTWDWVYAGLADFAKGGGHIIDYLALVYAQADYRIQTEPLCKKVSADQVVGPVSRTPRRSAGEIRGQLAVAEDVRMVLFTMGGVAQDYRFLDLDAVPGNVHLVISGGSDRVRTESRATWLPMDSDYYHPDLMHASDAVVAKVGYSTLAEAFNSGIPFGYIQRPGFQESEILAGFIDAHMHGIRVPVDAFYNGNWIRQLDRLFALPRIIRNHPNGAEQIAVFIADKIPLQRQK